MYLSTSGRRFINKSIKFRFPLYEIVRVTNLKDEYLNTECRIIGWTASRVIIVTLETEEQLTRVPKNLSQPY